jgi:hypothetical protein
MSKNYKKHHQGKILNHEIAHGFGGKKSSKAIWMADEPCKSSMLQF